MKKKHWLGGSCWGERSLNTKHDKVLWVVECTMSCQLAVRPTVVNVVARLLVRGGGSGGLELAQVHTLTYSRAHSWYRSHYCTGRWILMCNNNIDSSCAVRSWLVPPRRVLAGNTTSYRVCTIYSVAALSWNSIFLGETKYAQTKIICNSYLGGGGEFTLFPILMKLKTKRQIAAKMPLPLPKYPSSVSRGPRLKTENKLELSPIFELQPRSNDQRKTYQGRK